MRNVTRMSLLVPLLLLFVAIPAFAQDISLAWNPSSDSKVVGYKVYYKADSTIKPFDGAGAAEGHSPIDVGDKLSATLTGLPDGQVYYVAVTAYDALGQESPYSNTVASQWAPELLTPTDAAGGQQVPLQFSWSTPPTGQQVTYTLYYGTDPTLDPNSAVVATATTDGKHGPLLAGGLIFGLLGLPGLGNRKLRGVLTALVFGLGLLLYGCGGGGGPATTAPGDSSTSLGSGQTVNGGSQGLFTKKVTGIQDSFYVTTDLQPSTKYYWKVVVNDGTNLVESQVHSFTTAAF